MTAVLEKFEKYLEHINILERAADTIFWDMRTVMPEEGFKGQAQAATYFSTEVFKLSTSESQASCSSSLGMRSNSIAYRTGERASVPLKI